MAYATADLNLLTPASIGGGPRLWLYTSADAHGDVDASDYFDDGADKGLRVNDPMIVIDSSTATITMHRVTVVTAGGAATIGASAA